MARWYRSMSWRAASMVSSRLSMISRRRAYSCGSIMSEPSVTLRSRFLSARSTACCRRSTDSSIPCTLPTFAAMSSESCVARVMSPEPPNCWPIWERILLATAPRSPLVLVSSGLNIVGTMAVGLSANMSRVWVSGAAAGSGDSGMRLNWLSGASFRENRSCWAPSRPTVGICEPGWACRCAAGSIGVGSKSRPPSYSNGVRCCVT